MINTSITPPGKWSSGKKKKKLEEKKKRSSAGLLLESEMDEEKRKQRKQKEREFDEMIWATMKKDKVEEMRNQELLKVEMKLAHKQGDMDRVRSIEARLAPDQDYS
mmetsp:Transcript_18798/g.27739  ORF Transcript_18798/g.27739 Transcript_18798/m.27739 type:complete len:106 (+) Transcript_18798:267-584(+)